LVYLYQIEPDKLTEEAQKAYLDRELKVIAASYDIPIEKLLLAICIPCFILHWILYKFGSKNYLE